MTKRREDTSPKFIPFDELVLIKSRNDYCVACNNFNHWHEPGMQCSSNAIDKKYGTCWCCDPDPNR